MSNFEPKRIGPNTPSRDFRLITDENFRLMGRCVRAIGSQISVIVGGGGSTTGTGGFSGTVGTLPKFGPVGNTLEDSIVTESAGVITVTGDVIVTGLSASRLVSTNGSDQLTSVADLTTWIAGTASRITVADDGDGTATVDISSAYVGQTSITTLGTIATGTWQGTVVDEVYGGTGQSSYILGDTLYASAANTLAKLAGNTTTTKLFLSQTGDGVNSAAPAWSTITGSDLSGFTEGSVLFAGSSGEITEDNANFFWNDTDNVLVLGSEITGLSDPEAGMMQINLTGATNPANLLFSQFSDSNQGPHVNFLKARGTQASPSDVQSDDNVMSLVGYAYSNGWHDVGTARLKVDTESFTSGQAPSSRWIWLTNEANGTPSENMLLSSNGILVVGEGAAESGSTIDSHSRGKLWVGRDDTANVAAFQLADASSLGADIYLRKSRGSLSSPATVQDDDDLGVIFGSAYTNTWHNTLASIAFQVDDTVVAGQNPATRIVFYTNENNGSRSEKVRIASNGWVGIATTSPANPLHVIGGSGGTAGMRMQTSETDATTKQARIKCGHYTNSQEPFNMMIAESNSSNNILFIGGGSSFENAATEVRLYAAANNTTTTGTLMVSVNTSRMQVDGNITPDSDDTYDVGSASLRWDDIYATNGTIQTSASQEKRDIVESDLGLDFINALTPRRYRWTEGTRPHYGLIAEEVKTVMGASDFAGYIESNTVRKEYVEQRIDDLHRIQEVEVPVTHKGLRYQEFMAPMIKAIQELTVRLETLEAAT